MCAKCAKMFNFMFKFLKKESFGVPSETGVKLAVGFAQNELVIWHMKRVIRLIYFPFTSAGPRATFKGAPGHRHLRRPVLVGLADITTYVQCVTSKRHNH